MFSHFSKYTRPEPEKSALITIDLQNDFVLPGAPAEGEGAARVAAMTGAMVQYYRECGLPIVHIVRIYSPENNAVNVDACRREAIENGLQLVLPGTDGMQPVSDIIPEGVVADGELLLTGKPQRISATEHILYKPRWGSFYETKLDVMLREQGVTTAVIAGTWFANCIRTTIYEATAREYRVVALRDAIAGIHQAGEADLEKIQCGVCNCAEWRELLSTVTRP
ncbi:cysteine hydrolase family protein [Halodesulfovibrio marinisediminis]|uniref:Nicotinamidase-related amidase n=1 Tax=Halodesulfovibrio marinisediminis DSM 17456 TaxID=1121457 RepID=A0A1N6DUC9_9BACT|nr:isochorismatase family cysteine hydrolase [Halodesulfovibrio marinisediminis]SIN74408.1 Nicotinamidase-related amidase [Halodesulfovibrio marinisediminis DSM 17456]